jgi:hypothetical protein
VFGTSRRLGWVSYQQCGPRDFRKQEDQEISLDVYQPQDALLGDSIGPVPLPAAATQIQPQAQKGRSSGRTPRGVCVLPMKATRPGEQVEHFDRRFQRENPIRCRSSQPAEAVGSAKKGSSSSVPSGSSWK